MMQLDLLGGLVGPVVQIQIACKRNGGEHPVCLQPAEAVIKVSGEGVVEDALREGREIVGDVAPDHLSRESLQRRWHSVRRFESQSR